MLPQKKGLANTQGRHVDPIGETTSHAGTSNSISFLRRQWTYCLAATLLIGSAVWIYFIARPEAYLIYVPVILVGATSSTMVGMALTFLTKLIGDEKVCPSPHILFGVIWKIVSERERNERRAAGACQSLIK